MNYIDLFAGGGGFALGAYWAGMQFEKHYFSEVDEYAIKVYRRKFPGAIPLGDITKIDTKALADSAPMHGTEIKRVQQDGVLRKDAWIISGGFPCQDISVAGKGEGIGGSRSGLWFEMWRIIRELRPRYVIAENVGALTFRGLSRVLSSLAEIGYDAEWQDIRASDMGAPHRRERIWIVAYPRCEYDERRSSRRGGETGAGAFCRSPRCGEITDVADTEKRDGARVLPVAGRESRTCSSGEKDRGHSGDRIGNWWTTEPNMGRVANGIPSRVDRLKCLGNAIVPQIAEMLFRQIIESEEDRI